jgi:D-arabinose 1-dehydrogenase-like Zn-dependent alcohol dehydrogenase
VVLGTSPFSFSVSSPRGRREGQAPHSASLWGRRKELLELVEMAKRGQIKIKTTTYPIEDGEQAYADMHAGKIVGRAVVVP